MKFNQVITSLIIAFLLPGYTSLNAQLIDKNVNFLFPIDITPTAISGSFAELRSNHFHSGIDIGTNGKTGLPVMSAEDGVVSRIKVSSVGYGNALYIKHPNGYTTVYGHLEKYAPKIDSIITREQYKLQSFEIDYFPEVQISINKGEVIGFSGNTGSSGGAHLHYEIRDTKTEEPINPFFYQSLIKDDIRPKILTIRIYPLTNGSTINGEPKEKNFPVVFYDDRFHLKGNPKIVASGKIGIGIEMIDYMSGSWKKCGVYKLQLKVNDTTTYGWELDRFSFNESRYINSHIDYSYKTIHCKRFERCYKQPNNKLRVYDDNCINDGILNLDNTKEVNILASDAAGNSSQLNFKIYAGKFNSSFSQAPLNSYDKNLSYNSEHNIEEENVKCYFPNGALYDDIYFKIKKVANYHGFPAYQIGEKTIPLHKNITIDIDVPDSLISYGEKLTLATVNGSEHENLYYAGGEIIDNQIKLKTRTLGEYTFYIDTISPTIKPVNFVKGKTYLKKSTLIFKINDSYSGIKTYTGYINDQWTLFSYDKKTNTLSCNLYKAPVKGPASYKLKLVVSDNCNNESVYEGSFILK